MSSIRSDRVVSLIVNVSHGLSDLHRMGDVLLEFEEVVLARLLGQRRRSLSKWLGESRNAFVRTLDVRGIAPAVTEAGPVVTEEDFEQAFRELSATPRRPPIGFSLATWRS